ncbi:MAG: hypothetical protein P4L39_01685 [Humidesulfovibrio sp.]|nr:hypothetical protein [Humidesulfovibrio sp.]
MSLMSAIAQIPLTTQLLSFAVALQLVALLAVLWRGGPGMSGPTARRPRWPFFPLVLGTGAGLWYAVLQRDLVFGAAQGLALSVGFCLISGRREKRAARRGGHGNGE